MEEGAEGRSEKRERGDKITGLKGMMGWNWIQKGEKRRGREGGKRDGMTDEEQRQISGRRGG